MRIVSAALILASLLNSGASAAPTSCGLISAAEMSDVLGSAEPAVADDRGGQAKCTYSSNGDELGGAYAEVQLNWGVGVAGMKGAAPWNRNCERLRAILPVSGSKLRLWDR